MKKLFCLILILVLSIGVASVSYAAVEVSPEPVPAAPGITTEGEMYADEIIEIGSEDNVGGAAIIPDETIPKAALPRTGGIPAEVFYGVGALFVIAALILSRKKVKA